ncbi:SDR family oxidoreductase [Henriciella marina]|uniref:SDR family oxidoreductase n=1 Tax=Henriciella marina TaxID=453851 RepID=A0ABT4LQA2_9PROT|nr:SDR family oxidoreductase [Henriciella marina]MCZ4296438.1 SDR family oxidoreductase [Henriciella marina]
MAYILDLSGRTALVAGGSSGIGLGIARALKSAGADVHITGTRQSLSDYGEGEIRAGLTYHSLDVTHDAAVSALADKFEVLDILVSSVGSVAYSKAEYEIDIFRDIMNVNLNGVMHLCTCFKDTLARAEDGSVLLLGSTSSFVATPGQPAYSASKGALRTLTKSLAHAWARNGIRVNGLAPGFVETKLTKRSRDNDDVYQQSLKRIPLRRWGVPEEMGQVALFLVSPMSSYVTGQMLLADGGITLM